jgi:hypothetical protein
VTHRQDNPDQLAAFEHDIFDLPDFPTAGVLDSEAD